MYRDRTQDTIHGPTSHSDVYHHNDGDYLVQGRLNDPIIMTRKTNDILDCEQEEVTKMLEQEHKQQGTHHDD